MTGRGCATATPVLAYAVSGPAGGAGLATRQLALDGQDPWTVDGQGPVFTVVVDGVTVRGDSPGLVVEGVSTRELADGVVAETTTCGYATGGVGPGRDGIELAVDWHVVRYADLAVVETWVGVTNRGTAPVTVERLDSVGLTLRPAHYDVLSYTSSWGLEFEAVRAPLSGATSLGTLRGRSSHGMHPWFGLVRADGAVLCGAVAWSGNWVVRLDPLVEPPLDPVDPAGETAGAYVLTGGLHDSGFAKRLTPGSSIDAPPVLLALGYGGDLDTASIGLARAARTRSPRNTLADRLPVEWNHWWTYEDHSINQEVFRANVDAAAELGVEVCTLDAGWFGPADVASRWPELRGDWDQVNTARFPDGLRALADHVHDRGMAFGLWCEIEALGPKATLASRRPDLPALRDGERLGYVCLGNPAARDWAYDTLDRLVGVEGADWIKLDFNLDPGHGCNRTDHGHDADDGLFEHYTGYYTVLDRVRERHPELVLENCSSGGLRIDLGLQRHTHVTFLSDPDWPEHGLQLLWGATTMLHPSQILHWGYSQWYGEHDYQAFDPRDPELAPHRLDYYRRIAMLGATGMSWALPDLPDWVRDRLLGHISTYRDLVRPFVRTADVHRLTGAPRRFGEGERWAAAQYAQPDGSEHLVFAFRLHGGKPTEVVRLHALDPAGSYDVHWQDAGRREVLSGEELMTAGLHLALPEEGSELILLRRQGPETASADV
jgi:alpha-galactosidase